MIESSDPSDVELIALTAIAPPRTGDIESYHRAVRSQWRTFRAHRDKHGHNLSTHTLAAIDNHIRFCASRLNYAESPNKISF